MPAPTVRPPSRLAKAWPASSATGLPSATVTRLWEIDESDWQSAFVGLATAHMAVLRAALPRMKADGAYSVIVGASAFTPIPGSGLVSMEQATLLMQQVLAAELGGDNRVFVLQLGPVRTRLVEAGGAGPWLLRRPPPACPPAAGECAPSMTGPHGLSRIRVAPLSG